MIVVEVGGLVLPRQDVVAGLVCEHESSAHLMQVWLDPNLFRPLVSRRRGGPKLAPLLEKPLRPVARPDLSCPTVQRPSSEWPSRRSRLRMHRSPCTRRCRNPDPSDGSSRRAEPGRLGLRPLLWLRLVCRFAEHSPPVGPLAASLSFVQDNRPPRSEERAWIGESGQRRRRRLSRPSWTNCEATEG